MEERRGKGRERRGKGMKMMEERINCIMTEKN